MKKKNVIIAISSIVIISLLVIAILFFKTPKYEVTFSTDNEVYETIKVKEDGTVTEPTVPTKEGYKFIGWYYNGEKFDFSTKVTKDMKLVAKWEKVTNLESSIAEEKTTTKKTTTKKTTNKKSTNKTTTTKTTIKKEEITTTAVTTTTKDNLSYEWIPLKDDTIGQYTLYITNNGVKTAGNCDITFNSGKTVNVEIPKTGYVTVKSIINKISNIKLK